jgi:hypothetical protein
MTAGAFNIEQFTRLKRAPSLRNFKGGLKVIDGNEEQPEKQASIMTSIEAE